MGVNTLQANRANLNKYAVNPTCKRCNVEPEDRALLSEMYIPGHHYREKLSDFISSLLPQRLNSMLTGLYCIKCSKFIQRQVT